MPESKPLEEMTKEELIEEDQLLAVVRGEGETEMEYLKERIAQLEQDRDHLLHDIEEAARDHDEDIERWKERCRQEIAFKVQCMQSLTSVVEERDDLKEHIRRLEVENTELKRQNQYLVLWMDDMAKSIPEVREVLEQLAFWETYGSPFALPRIPKLKFRRML